MTSTTTPARPNNILAGILSMLAAGLLFGIMGAFGREAMTRFSFAEVTFFRCILAVIPGLILGLATSGWKSQRVRNKKLMLACGTTMTGMLCFYFLTIHLLPMNDAIVLGFISAPLMAVLSGPFLRERVSAVRFATVAIGFIGVIIIANPTGGAGFNTLGVICAVLGATSSAMTWLMLRRWGTQENSIAISSGMQLVAGAYCLIMMPFVWKAPIWDVATPRDWLFLGAVGIIGGAAQIPLSHAYRVAPIAVVAPFWYTSEVFVFFIAWAAWDELPSWRTVIGCTVIVGAALFLLAHETLSARRRASPA